MNAAATPTISGKKNWRRLALLGVPLAALYALISTCSPRHDQLSQVRQSGTLRVATINSPTTYYIGAGGPLGFEYDLAKGLADDLGVKLEMVVAANPGEALAMVRAGTVQFAAAALADTPEREKLVRFSQTLLTVVPQLVYRLGQPRPDNLGEVDGRLKVQHGSVHAELLRQAQRTYPKLKWEEATDEETEELLYQVANGDLAYTIANSDIIAIDQRYYPKLRVAFALSAKQNIAWAFPRGSDTSLYDAVGDYLKRTSGSEMARLHDRYFGHIDQVDYMGAVTLASLVQTRLVRYRKAFEDAAKRHDLDWRLLAAMGYQESHWDEDAVSPTGVRGLMMLTLDTANFLNVRDREDPMQSIEGGARYFRQLLDQLPPSIEEPDRSWMGLAAYNIGVGHLLDARELTRVLGRDADRWLDVRNSLPLLTQASWYSKTRHGYARGYETVAYVGNVRTYYDMLRWITEGNAGKREELEPEPPLQTPHVEPKNELHIDTPIF